MVQSHPNHKVTVTTSPVRVVWKHQQSKHIEKFFTNSLKKRSQDVPELSQRPSVYIDLLAVRSSHRPTGRSRPTMAKDELHEIKRPSVKCLKSMFEHRPHSNTPTKETFNQAPPPSKSRRKPLALIGRQDPLFSRSLETPVRKQKPFVERSISSPSTISILFPGGTKEQLPSDVADSQDTLTSSNSSEVGVSSPRTPMVKPSGLGVSSNWLFKSTSVSRMRKRWENISQHTDESFLLSTTQSSPNLSTALESTMGEISQKTLPKSEAVCDLSVKPFERTEARGSVKNLVKLFGASKKLFEKQTDTYKSSPGISFYDDFQPAELAEVTVLEMTLNDAMLADQTIVQEDITQHQVVSPLLQRQGSVKILRQKFDRIETDVPLNYSHSSTSSNVPDTSIAIEEKIIVEKHLDSIATSDTIHDTKTDLNLPSADDTDSKRPETLIYLKDDPIPQIEPPQSINVINTSELANENDLTGQRSGQSTPNMPSPMLSTHRSLHPDEANLFSRISPIYKPQTTGDIKPEKNSASPPIRSKRCRTLHPDELKFFSQPTTDMFNMKAGSASIKFKMALVPMDTSQ